MTSISIDDQGSKKIPQSNLFRLVQIFWFICALVALGVILASLPGYWKEIIEGIFLRENTATTNTTISMNLLGTLASLFAALVSFLLAIVLFWRKADEIMALTLSFFLLAYSIILGGPMEVLFDIYRLPFDIINLAASILLTVPLIAFEFLFPNGRFIPRWTRWALLLAIIVFFFLFTTPIDQWFTGQSFIALFVTIIFAIIHILGIYAQIYRYWNVSSFSERRQTKWVLYGFWLFLSLLAIAGFMSGFDPGELQSWWEPLAGMIWWIAMCIMPVTFFIAIQRYSLWDIDAIIRKTLVYGAITVMLVLVYFGSVVLLQQAFRALSGQDSPVAIVISTLVIAALFNPLRSRIQETIDRRFYRRKYDAQQALATFAATARDEVELEQLTQQLLSVVQDTMQPDQISLWLQSYSDRQIDDNRAGAD